jgi:hypothetical protein
MNKSNKLWLAVAMDVTMIVLILVNINLIVFDSFFSIHVISGFFQNYIPCFFEFYNTNIHQHFAVIDLCFVAIFLIEFIARWARAAYRKTYDKWYFFPFFFWYDALGCVPVAGFRWLRLIRIFSLLIRMQKLGLVNWRKTGFYSYFVRYSNIFIEEISDRVIVKALEGLKDEVAKGNPVTDEIIREVVKPQSQMLVKWMSHRIQIVTAKMYVNRKDDIKRYVDERLNDAVTKNKQVKMLGKIPVVGSQVTGLLDQAIRDIVFSVIDGLFQDLQENNQPLTEELTNISSELFTLIEDDKELDTIIENIINQSIDIVIKQVEIKEWKTNEN